MAEDTTMASPEEATTQTKEPWYSMNPRVALRSKWVLAVLLLALFSIVPLWRLGWYFPIYAARNFLPVRDAHGHWQKAWRWVTGKEIRVYVAPGVRPKQAEIIADGARALMHDADLDFTVNVLPLPANVREAYEASLVDKTVNGTRQRCIDFGKLESHLIELHAGDPHADMLVVKEPLADCWWAHGMATFTSGVGVLEDNNVDFHLGKHESCHLVGYLYHDSLPAFVIGYPWEGFPWNRDTLMMLYSPSTTLSPRAHDALRYFWRGMEHRMKRKFLKE